MPPLEAILALNALPKIGPVRIRRLLERFGDAATVLRAPPDRLLQVDGIGPESAAIIARWQDHADPAAELRRARESGVSIVLPDDPLFPAPLREAYDAPLLLYVRGRLDPADRHAIAIVGSRRMTHYGRQITRKFSFQLARAGFTIVSGLARGIDTAAHEAAIAAGGRTIAVIGAGLAKLYPPENAGLADQIAAGHGAVVSEFPLDTPPDKQTFPMRNRIVAAWARAVLVAESPAWSGSLITANLASDYGRPVFAIPGPVDRPSSAGCHHLIRNGATLVADPSDLLDDLGELPLGQASLRLDDDSSQPAAPALPPDEAAVLAAVGPDETPVDHIIDTTGLPAPVVTATLLKLEIRRLVRQLPGFRYARR